MKTKILTASLILSLSSCSTISTQGQSIGDSEASELKNKKMSKEEVQDLIGTPTIYDENIAPESWYYVQRTMSTRAFFEPTVLEQKITRVDFDPQGYSKDVSVIENSHREGIIIEKEYNRTKGTEMNQFQKFFRNFGRFSKGKSGKRSKGARR